MDFGSDAGPLKDPSRRYKQHPHNSQPTHMTPNFPKCGTQIIFPKCHHHEEDLHLAPLRLPASAPTAMKMIPPLPSLFRPPPLLGRFRAADHHLLHEDLDCVLHVRAPFPVLLKCVLEDAFPTGDLKFRLCFAELCFLAQHKGDSSRTPARLDGVGIKDPAAARTPASPIAAPTHSAHKISSLGIRVAIIIIINGVDVGLVSSIKKGGADEDVRLDRSLLYLLYASCPVDAPPSSDEAISYPLPPFIACVRLVLRTIAAGGLPGEIAIHHK